MHTIPYRYSQPHKHLRMQNIAPTNLEFNPQSVGMENKGACVIDREWMCMEVIPFYTDFSNEQHRRIQSTTYCVHCSSKLKACAALRFIVFNNEFFFLSIFSFSLVSHLSSTDFLINFPRIYKLFESRLKLLKADDKKRALMHHWNGKQNAIHCFHVMIYLLYSFRTTTAKTAVRIISNCFELKRVSYWKGKTILLEQQNFVHWSYSTVYP